MTHSPALHFLRINGPNARLAPASGGFADPPDATLAEGLRFVTHLQMLSLLELNLNGATIDPQGMHWIQSLGTCRSLVTLRLSLWGTGQNGPALRAIATALAGLCDGLRILSLDLGANDLPEDAVVLLMQTIRRLRVLDMLSLGFQGNPFSRRGVQALCHGIGRIERLELSLAYCGLVDEDIGRLVATLQTRPLLRRCCLDLRSNRVSDTGAMLFVHLMAIPVCTVHLSGNPVTMDGCRRLQGVLTPGMHLEQGTRSVFTAAH